jgi:hypothetical protein
VCYFESFIGVLNIIVKLNKFTVLFLHFLSCFLSTFFLIKKKRVLGQFAMRLEEMRREGKVTNAEWTEVGFRGVEGAISALVLGMVLFAARARGCSTMW